MFKNYVLTSYEHSKAAGFYKPAK